MYADTGETEINDQIIAIAGKYNNVKTFTLRNYVCTNGTCSAYLRGKPIYFDLGSLEHGRVRADWADIGCREKYAWIDFSKIEVNEAAQWSPLSRELWHERSLPTQ